MQFFVEFWVTERDTLFLNSYHYCQLNILHVKTSFGMFFLNVNIYHGFWKMKPKSPKALSSLSYDTPFSISWSLCQKILAQDFLYKKVVWNKLSTTLQSLYFRTVITNAGQKRIFNFITFFRLCDLNFVQLVIAYDTDFSQMVYKNVYIIWK